MLNLLWNIIQQRSIQDLEKETFNTGIDASILACQVKRLKNEVSSLRLALTAVSELGADKLNITEDDIREKITEIDLRDGILDNADNSGSAKAGMTES